jgi:hypothetical protein
MTEQVRKPEALRAVFFLFLFLITRVWVLNVSERADPCGTLCSYPESVISETFWTSTRWSHGCVVRFVIPAFCIIVLGSLNVFEA